MITRENHQENPTIVQTLSDQAELPVNREYNSRLEALEAIMRLAVSDEIWQVFLIYDKTRSEMTEKAMAAAVQQGINFARKLATLTTDQPTVH